MQSKTYKIKEIGQVITGKTPHTKRIEYYDDPEVPFFTPSDYLDNRRYLKETKTQLHKSVIKDFSKYILPVNSIMVTCIGSDMGKIALNKTAGISNQQINSIVVNTDSHSTEYIYYTLTKKYPLLRKMAEGSGSTMPIINKTDFSNLEINLPPLPEQKRIASILSSFDNKIELLREQNKTLENIAQTIFKEWFVNYNFPNKDGKPYKDNGGKMIESELGMIPEGWRVESLENVTSLITDGSHFSPKSQHTGYPIASVKDMTEWQIDFSSCRKISKKDYEKLVENNCAPQKGDILIAKDGSYLKHAFIQQKEEPFVVLSSIAFLRTNEKLNPYLLNLILKLKSTLVRMENIVSGAVIRRIILKDFKSFEIVVPSIEIQRLMTTHIEDSYKKIWNNINAIEKLYESKNILLKELIK